MTTITLQSNNKLALAAVITTINNEGWVAARASVWMQTFKVTFSFTNRVGADAAIDYRFHYLVNLDLTTSEITA